jgi:hypothetical protein
VSWFEAFNLTPIKRVISLGVCVTLLCEGEFGQCGKGGKDSQVRIDLLCMYL